jgi:hypothetical protein
MTRREESLISYLWIVPFAFSLGHVEGQRLPLARMRPQYVGLDVLRAPLFRDEVAKICIAAFPCHCSILEIPSVPAES